MQGSRLGTEGETQKCVVPAQIEQDGENRDPENFDNQFILMPNQGWYPQAWCLYYCYANTSS